MKYPVTEIFRSIQGEGHFVGYPMAFVRLAGCSVTGCSIRKECDEAPWKATSTLDEREIVERVHGAPIVCITGGEPTDHDLLPLIVALRSSEHRVHLETSGERSVEGYPFDWLTVSPKTFNFVQRTGHTIKLVVRPEWNEEELWARLNHIESTTSFFHRYIQPLTGYDGKPLNMASVVEAVTDPRNKVWALSTQAHRFWGVH